MTKKIFAMFLAVLMVVSMLPTSVFAAGCPLKGTDDHTIENCEWTVVNVTAPSCGKEGYTSYKCNACGDLFIDSMVPATGEHVWKEVPQQDPTCEKDGLTAGYKCEVCGAEKGRETIKKLYTDRKCEWTAWTPAKLDCTVGGEKTRECKHCGAVEKQEVKKTNNHVWGEPVLKTAATAEADGLAIVACTNPNCDVTKEVKVFFAHTCVPGIVPAVAPNCNTETNGTKEHYACRVCGKTFWDAEGKSTAKAADLVWKWEHDFGDQKLDCTVSYAYCSNECCKKNVPVSMPHDVEVTSYKAATCVAPGYEIGECKVCEYVIYNQIPALGHLTYTVSQPATCGTFAYSYTVCLRGCDDKSVTVVPGVDNMDVYMDPDYDIWYDVTMVPHFLVMNHGGIGKTVYFNGTVSSNYYLGVTEKVEEAVVMFMEEVEELKGAYYFYFVNEKNEKVYVDIVKVENESGVHYNAVMASEPTNYFTWNATQKAWTVSIDNEEFYLGARSDKQYFNIDAMKVSKYPAEKNSVANMTELDETVINITIDYKGGLDENNHKLITVVTKPTCHTTGLIYSYCYNHSCPSNYTESTVLEKVDHVWVEATEAEVKAAGLKWAAKKPATCTTKGEVFMKCAFEGCGKVEKHTQPAKGHNYDATKPVDGTYAGDHKNDAHDYWICKDCGTHIKTNFRKWAGLNHTWETLEEAVAAHGCKLIDMGSFTVKGDCANLALRKYKCSDPACDAKVIYVKVMDNFEMTGSHSFLKWVCEEEGCKGNDYYNVCYKNGHKGQFVSTLECKDPNCTEANCTGMKEATCTEKGYFITYQCTRCGAIVGDAQLGYHNEIAMKDHEMVANKSYKVTDCDKPNFNAYSHYCKNCDYKVYPTHQDNTLIPGSSFGNSATKASCTTQDYTYYMCACGEEHIINFVGPFGHETVEVEGTRTQPTCRDEAKYQIKCLHCDYTKWETVGTLPHVNAAGEKFFDHCNDTVTDRHCVECCKFYNHKALGEAHDCYAKDKNGNFVCIDKCQIGRYCDYIIDEWRESTCTTNAHTLKVCRYCGAEKVDFAPSAWWNGHKPEAAGSELYANYVYETYTWKYVVVTDVLEDGVTVKAFENKEETYVAKFLEYKAPTYTADGYYKAFCTECQQVVEQILPKKDRLEIVLDVINGNGATEYTYGSLVEVLVTANGLEEAVYGFDFALNYTEGLVFVGYETLNTNFVYTITNPEAVKDNTVKFTAIAENDASGKMQNIAVNPGTELVKLYFRVDSENASVKTFMFQNYKATAVKNSVTSDIVCDFVPKTIATRTFLDFNGNGFSVNDLYLAMTLLTGEHPAGKTYDVTVDVDKNGEVTLEDLSLAYNYHVGNISKTDLFVMGMSDAEIELMNLNKATICNNSACQKEIASNATYCPYCGNHQ